MAENELENGGAQQDPAGDSGDSPHVVVLECPDLIRDMRNFPMTDHGPTSFQDRVVDRLDFGGLRVEVYPDEEPPPHFHVVQGKGQGEHRPKFSIADGSHLGGKGLEKFHGNIKKWAIKNYEELVRAWNETRPDDCPVGPIDMSRPPG